MALIFVSTLTKKDAKRLFFFCPQQRTDTDGKPLRKQYAGRTQGKHLENEEVKIHAFGRSVWSMPTTNGFTFKIKWSCSNAQLRPQDLVCVQVFKTERYWELVISPSQHHRKGGLSEGERPGILNEELRDVVLENITPDSLFIIKQDNKIIFDFKSTQHKGGKLFIRKDDITEKAWKIWSEDLWKYDMLMSFSSGSLVVSKPPVKPGIGTEVENQIEQF